MKSETGQPSDSTKRSYRKTQFDWQDAALKAAAFFATSFLAGAASAAGARAAHAIANSLRKDSNGDGNMILMNRAI